MQPCGLYIKLEIIIYVLSGIESDGVKLDRNRSEKRRIAV